MRRLVLLLALVLAACSTPPSTVGGAVWGETLVLGTAEQTTAPALAVHPARVLVSWIGADGRGVHQDARLLTGGRASSTVVLPLPPTAPRASTLHSAAGDAHHLLWLDLNGEKVQLYTALIDGGLEVSRGPLAVSEVGARCYDAFPGADGALWVIWDSGGRTPGLTSAFIDPTGLVLRRQSVSDVGGCPAIAQTSDAAYVLWGAGAQLMRGQIVDGRLLDILPVATAPSLAAGDRLRSLRAGAGGEWLYAFWNITRADGRHETWVGLGLTDAAAWSRPVRLRITTDEATAYETTYNTGRTVAARGGEDGGAVAWASPLRGVSGVLPVAVELDGSLGVVYFDGGAVKGYQRVVGVRGLLGEPELRTDRDRHLYLAWTEPTDIGAAEVWLTATRSVVGR